MSTISSLLMASRVLRSQILKPISTHTPSCCKNVTFLEKMFLTSSPIKHNSTMGFKASDKSCDKLKKMDNVSDDYELIYKAPMELLLKVTYPIVGLCAVLPPIKMTHQYLLEGKISLAPVGDFIKDMHLNNNLLEIFIFGGALSLMALATHGIIFKYAFRVYKHKERDEYIALFLSYVPFFLRKFNFQSATHVEFKNPFYSLMMKGCHFRLDGKNTFLMLQYFRTPIDLYKMVGER